jgi:hypothetical protein
MEGQDQSQWRYIPVAALLEEVTLTSPELEDTVVEAMERAHMDVASPALIGDNEKPRMLKLTAWIAHGGSKPNGNRQGFRSEDLEQRVNEGLFGAPYFGMVDFNHQFDSLGVWYSAKWEYDPKAEEWGILAEGALFAWRYAEITDRLLAMQARNGFIDVSMACIGLGYEMAEDESGPFEIISRPVFFTTSVLDVAPADKDARGLGTEDPEQTQADRERTLTTASTNMEESMDETILERIAEMISQASEDNSAALSTLVTASERVPVLEAEVATATDRIAELEEANAAVAADLEAAQTAADEATITLETVRAELEAANTELEELRQFRADVETREADEARAELRETRLGALPEAARNALETMEEAKRTRLEDRWLDMDEAEWDLTLAALKVGSRKSKEQMSREEGLIPGLSDSIGGKYAIDRL